MQRARPVAARQDDGELLTAVPGKQIPGSEMSLPLVPELLEQQVTRLMAAAVGEPPPTTRRPTARRLGGWLESRANRHLELAPPVRLENPARACAGDILCGLADDSSDILRHRELVGDARHGVEVVLPLAHLLLGPLLCGEIAEVSQQVVWSTALAAHDPDAEQRPDDGSVGQQVALFLVVGVDLVAGDSADSDDRRVAVVRVCELRSAAADELVS